MPVWLHIAQRYLRSKSSNNAINIMSLIASVGVIVASAALIIVLSVFSGLREFSLDFTSFVDPDLKLTPKNGKSFLWTSKSNQVLLKIEGIKAASQIIEERIVIKSENKNQLVQLKAVDENYLKVTQIDTMIKDRGEWLKPNTNEIVSGCIVSSKLSFDILNFNNPVTLYVPRPGKGQFSTLKGAYNAVYVNNVGLFDINEVLNSNYIFADINLARSLLNYNTEQITALELKLDANSNETKIVAAIEKAFPNTFVIKNREALNDALYKMLNTEEMAIYLIFTLVIIIALFNIIGALIMMVLDRKKSLYTLFSLGMTLQSIRNIFFAQGTLMTMLSGLLGLCIGVVIVILQHQFELIKMTATLAFPVKLTLKNILLVFFTIFLLGVIASKLASQRINFSLFEKKE